MSCGPWGVNLDRVGTEVWPLESNADMNFDGADNGKLGASPRSSWPSKHLLGNGKQAGLEIEHPKSTSGPPPLRSGRPEVCWDA